MTDWRAATVRRPFGRCRTTPHSTRMIVVAVHAWHGVMTHGVMAHGVMVPRRAPHGSDIELDVNAARFRKNQRALEMLARCEWLPKIHEHEVEGTGFQFDGCSRFDLEAVRKRPHFGHAVYSGHLVDGEVASDGYRTANEAVGVGALIGHRQVTGGNTRALWCCGRPGVVDFKRSEFKVARARKADAERQ